MLCTPGRLLGRPQLLGARGAQIQGQVLHAGQLQERNRLPRHADTRRRHADGAVPAAQRRPGHAARLGMSGRHAVRGRAGHAIHGILSRMASGTRRRHVRDSAERRPHPLGGRSDDAVPRQRTRVGKAGREGLCNRRPIHIHDRKWAADNAVVKLGGGRLLRRAYLFRRRHIRPVEARRAAAVLARWRARYAV